MSGEDDTKRPEFVPQFMYEWAEDPNKPVDSEVPFWMKQGEFARVDEVLEDTTWFDQTRKPEWIGKPKTQLMWAVMGGPAHLKQRASNVMQRLSLHFDDLELEQRLERLDAMGYCEEGIPRRYQLANAGADQAFFAANASQNDDYNAKGIDPIFHTLRRFIMDPMEISDSTGLLLPENSMATHLLITLHKCAKYDLDATYGIHGMEGIDRIEDEFNRYLNGVHPLQDQIRNLVDDPMWPLIMLSELDRFRIDPDYDEPYRRVTQPTDNVYLSMAGEQFTDLKGFMRYAARMEGTDKELKKELNRKKRAFVTYGLVNMVRQSRETGVMGWLNQRFNRIAPVVGARIDKRLKQLSDKCIELKVNPSYIDADIRERYMPNHAFDL